MGWYGEIECHHDRQVYRPLLSIYNGLVLSAVSTVMYMDLYLAIIMGRNGEPYKDIMTGKYTDLYIHIFMD
jgi:hypothetical protein